MQKEYNLLTRKLLKEGYDAEHYPDYVRMDSSRLPGNDPLNNLAGGFCYKRTYIADMVYKTGCGKHVLGKNILDSMNYMGVHWCYENDNPVFRCPYDNAACIHNDERLHGEHGGGLCMQCFCTCKRTDEVYNYENSIEKANKEREEEIKRKYEESVKVHNGRVCRNHMYYDERNRSWSLRYDPKKCARFCIAKDGYCPILGKTLSRKRGNVYYDLKQIVVPYKDKQLSLFDKEEHKCVFIEKGIRYFPSPCSMDICEAFVKVQKDEIYREYYWNNSYKNWSYESWEFEIMNVRAESKPSRDLMQDLADIKAGIRITHASDNEKRQKEEKKKRSMLAREKKIEKLEKKLLDIGYENLEEHSLDRVHADKWLGVERIREIQMLREDIKLHTNEQMSILDLLEE